MDDQDRKAEASAKIRVTKKSGFKLREKGALHLEFTLGRVFAYRPLPPRAWTIAKNDGSARWLGLRDPPLPLGPLIRQIRIEDALLAGTLQRQQVPDNLLPERGPFHVRRRQNLRLFLAHVSRDVQDAVAAGFVEETWPLFRFLQSTPSALALCQSEDGARIAWLLANAHHLLPAEPSAPPPSADEAAANVRLPDTLAFARRWSGKKRRDILGRFGFPATKASVTALAKVPRHHLATDTAKNLRTTLLHPTSRDFAAHLPRLSRAALALLALPELAVRVDHSFLAELSTDDRTDLMAGDAASVLRDTIELAGQLDATLPLYSSRAVLRAVHDQLTQTARNLAAAPALPLPPLPLPLSTIARFFDGFTVLPLTTTKALSDEGKVMHHCLGTLDSHRTLALQGRFIAFVVDGAMRATVAFVRPDVPAGQGPTGGWRLYDFKGFANAPVSQTMTEAALVVVRRLNKQEPAARQAVV